MSLSLNFLQNKENRSIAVAILLMGYLYLDTPVPFNILLERGSLVASILVVLYIMYLLSTNLNLYVAIIFAIVSYEVIRKCMKQDPKNLNKNVRFYDNLTSNSDIVISEKLKESTTLEQEMVENMVPLVTPDSSPTPRYQAVLSNVDGTAPVDYDGML